MKENKARKPDVLDNGIQRFAVSGLSKERYDEAVAEEILVDKKTGEFLLNTLDEVLISNDSLSRFKASFDNAVWMAKQVGLCGNIYQVEIDDIDMPSEIPYNTNILNEPIVIASVNKKILFNFDLNEYIVQDAKAITLNNECTVTVDIKQGGKNKTVKLSLSDMNSSIIDLTNFSSGEIHVKSIKFNEHVDYIGISKLILHNVFLTINK